MTALLEACGLSVDIAAQPVCRDLDLAIAAGQCWALLGRNGVGKTTLLYHLAGLRHDHRGKVRLQGQPLDRLSARERARRLGLLLQHSSRGFGASVLETVLTGRHPHLPALSWEQDDDLAIAHAQLEALELEAMADRSLDTLSGGELRRVEIARLLAQDCRLSILDEPMNHLDLAHQAACLRVLRDRCVTGSRALLMTIHDLNLAYRACDHWLILDGGGDWHAGPRETLCDPVLLSRTFGHPIARIETDAGPLLLAQP